MKRNHRDLIVWQQAVKLVVEICALTSSFPKSEQFGLVSQLRRAAVSAPANIAEGAARKGSKEYLQFLSIASGSLSELDTLLTVAHKPDYVEDATATLARIDSTSGLVMGLAAAIRRKVSAS